MDLSHISLLDLALIVLVLAGAFALVALGRSLMQLAASIKEISDRLNTALDTLEPSLVQINALADELPAILAEAQPLLKKTGTVIDALSLDLLRVEGILSDLSHATGAVNKVSNSASRAANSVSSTIVGATNSIKERFGFGTKKKKESSKTAQKAAAEEVLGQDFSKASDQNSALLHDSQNLSKTSENQSESAEYFSYSAAAKAEPKLEPKFSDSSKN